MTEKLSRHLPPAAVQLLLACFCLVCFGIVAEQVATRCTITTFDFHQAERFHHYAQAHPELHRFADFITDLGAGRPRYVVCIATIIILLAHRHWRLAIFFAATQRLLPEVVALAKDAFERPRPSFCDIGGWAFPSGHATGAMATYGMIAFLVAWRWPDRWFRWLMVAGLGLIILAVGLSRMVLGVHYFTDVLGGYLLGLAYISLCVAGIEWARSVRDRSRTP